MSNCLFGLMFYDMTVVSRSQALTSASNYRKIHANHSTKGVAAMAQNYTEQLRKDNVRDAIYEDLQNNCEVLRTSWSGNAFPANPKVGQPCYRVDEDKLYYWNGYKWSQKGESQSDILNYTTNRILEIPQDIKLELNNGTLTLKAGSKVYVPNGFEADGTTPKFGSITVASDLSVSASWGISGETFVYYNISGSGLFIEHPNYNKGSGTTFVSDGTYYYTDSNYIRRMINGSVAYTLSFPLAKITITSDNKVASIDQIFNGFGYIGSTVFTLPGVKGQYANGRNADGTCKSIVTTTTKVYTFTPTLGNVNDVSVWLRSGGTITATNEFYYDSDKNQIIYSQDNTALTNICVAKFNWVDGKITSFEPFNVDSVLNSSLSNLSSAGQAKFDAKANVDLDNLSTAGQAKFDAKANVSNTVTTDTNQTISASKKMSIGGTVAYSRPIEIMMPTSTESNPTENKSREIAFISSEGEGERYEGSLTHTRFTAGESFTGLRAGRLVNGTYKEGALGVRTLENGISFATAPSTPNNPPNIAIVTADYVKNNYVDKTSTQTISGSKSFTQPSAGMSIELTADTNQQTVPTTATIRQLGLYRNATHSKGDGYTSWINAVRGSDGWTATEIYARRFLEGDSQEILNYVKVDISPDGIPVTYTRTPPAYVSGEEIVTAGWFNSKMQVVSALPAAPDANVFYFIPG